jgi:hypothetical protein
MLGGMSGLRVSVQRPRSRFSVGVFDAVQLPLIGLKLAGVISWPWSMVLLPVWFGLGSLLIIALYIGVTVACQRVTLFIQDRRSGEPVALLMPNRKEDQPR